MLGDGRSNGTMMKDISGGIGVGIFSVKNNCVVKHFLNLNVYIK